MLVIAGNLTGPLAFLAKMMIKITMMVTMTMMMMKMMIAMIMTKMTMAKTTFALINASHFTLLSVLQRYCK